MSAENPVLRLRGLEVTYRARHADVRAVRGVDLDVAPGRTLALVGESGSGKSATLLGALGLLDVDGEVTGGQVALHGRPVSGRQLRRHLGRDVGVIFQDPLTALHPSMTIGAQLVEALRVHDRRLRRRDARRRAAELLAEVGVPRADQRLGDHPHTWSGGMRQRAAIAMAIAHRPALLIADEPTTALDVTVQAQILRLLARIRDEHGMAMVLVTHDLGVVAGVADEVAVMYHGHVVERAPVDELYARPAHPYTAALLDSRRTLDDPSCPCQPIGGVPAGAELELPGCAFAPRCPRADERCTTERPRLTPRQDVGEVACHHPRTELPIVEAGA